MVTFGDLTWQRHTHRSPGIIPMISYMSLNLKIRHKEPVHSWKISITLFPLDLYLILWYFRPLHDINFAINLTLAKKFIGRFITYFTVIQTKTYIFRISIFPKSICDRTTVKKCWSHSKILFWTWKQLFAMHFLLATSNVCLLAIP